MFHNIAFTRYGKVVCINTYVNSILSDFLQCKTSAYSPYDRSDIPRPDDTPWCHAAHFGCFTILVQIEHMINAPPAVDGMENFHFTISMMYTQHSHRISLFLLGNYICNLLIFHRVPMVGATWNNLFDEKNFFWWLITVRSLPECTDDYKNLDMSAKQPAKSGKLLAIEWTEIT